MNLLFRTWKVGSIMNNWVVNERGPIGNSGMANNASIIRLFFTDSKWTINAISAIVGNMQAESGINPGRWENDNVGNLGGGFGLVQWTPATKLRNWIRSTYGDSDYSNGDYQLERVIYELNNGLQYAPAKGFKENFYEWTQSTKKPGYLAAAFLCNYERAADTGWGAQIKRARIAEAWYQTFTGENPGKWIPPGLICAMKKMTERRI